MKAKFAWILPIALGVLALDHLTKWWIDRSLAIGDGFPVWDGFFDIVHVRNFGSAFGLFADSAPGPRALFFILSSAVALIFLIYYVRETAARDRLGLTSLALILGGAFGNISDRLYRGSVVDFLSFHWRDAHWSGRLFGRDVDILLSWPSFNVADIAITSGVTLLLIATLKQPKQPT